MEQPKDADSQRGARARGREIPKGAKSHTARNPIRREVPNGAKSQKADRARSPEERECLQSGHQARAQFPIARTLVPKRRLGCRAVSAFRNSALFGISRRSGFRAVRDFAPFGISRPLEFLSPCRFRFQGRSRFIILGNAITSRICGDPRIQATVLSKPRPKPEWMKVP